MAKNSLLGTSAVAVLCLSLTLNVVLGLRYQRAPKKRSNIVVSGQLLPALDGQSPTGAPTRLNFATRKVLYVFAPGCTWCKRDWQNVKALRAALTDRIDFVAVTTDSDAAAVKKFVDEHSYPAQVIMVTKRLVGEEVIKALGVTPQLLVVEAGGRVEKTWQGALSGTRKSEVEQYLGLQVPLPGTPDLDVTPPAAPRR